MSKKISNNPIDDLTIDWGKDPNFNNYPFSGEQVQKFIKGHLNSITHYVSTSMNGQYLTMMGFRSKEEWELYRDYDESLKDEAKELYVLWEATQDVSIDSTGKTTIGLINKGNTSYDTIAKKVTLKLRYTSVLKTDSGSGVVTTDSGEKGTLKIQKRIGNTWDTVATIPDIEPVPFQDLDAYREVDLPSDIIAEGQNTYHLIMTGQEYNVDSAPITINVNYSNVSIEDATQWWKPFTGNEINFNSFIHGTVDKSIFITINGITREYDEIGTGVAVDSAYTTTVNKSDFNLHHGVYDVEMYLKFKNADVETEPITFPIMVAEEGNNNLLIACSDIKYQVNNWSRVSLMKFAVYNPVGGPTPIYIDIRNKGTLDSLYKTNNVYENNTDRPYELAFTMSFELTSNTQTPITVMFGDEPSVSHPVTTISGIVVNTVGNYGFTTGATLKVDPEIHKIIDYTQGNADVTEELLDTSGWTVNDGWKVDSDNIPVLRTMAGSHTAINYHVFDKNTGIINGQNEGSITFDIRFKVSNIVDEEEPIIDISHPYINDTFLGFRIYPLEALLLTDNHPDKTTSNVPLREGVVQHLTVSIVRDVRAAGFTKGVNIVRLYLNGNLRREYLYNKEDVATGQVTRDYFVDLNQATPPIISIGSNSADIDIYAIRVYKGRILSMAQCVQNYMAAMPSIEEKIDFYSKNQGILGSNQDIDRDLAEAAGFNTVTYILQDGQELPSFEHQKMSGLINVRLHIDQSWCENAKYISGMFYNMTNKGQGTTAKTYAEWNQQQGFGKTKDGDAADGYFVNELGENLGAGWYPDYNGDTEHKGIKVTKIVDKRNYASGMQSHKIGSTSAFNDLWQRVVGANQIGENGQQFTIPGRRAVKEYPCLAFVQKGDVKTFIGLATTGSGKGDKETFGMDTKKNPNFLMLEGSNNGNPVTMFQVPWDDQVTYNTEEEYYQYNGAGSWDFDMGDKEDTPDGGTRPINGALLSVEKFKTFQKWVYQLSPFLVFLGIGNTLETLNANASDYDTSHQYYDTDLNVYRYDHVTKKFVNAGATKEGGQWTALNLVTNLGEYFSQELFDSTVNWDDRTQYLINCRIRKFKAELGNYVHVPDALFHHCFIRLIAGTDNRCKNTYFWILGLNKDGNGDNLIRFDQDDLDTIFRTDNLGLLTKLYWILEHDKRSDGLNFWTAEDNVFFSLIELAYEDYDADAEYSLPKTMKSIFTAMASLCGSPEQFFDEYYFRIQKYFPAVAYNKTAEKLYEKYSILNQNGTTLYSSGVDPITQSLGNQLEGEQDYIEKRLPMMYSYCSYGPFAAGTDVPGVLGFRSGINQATSVTYTLTPYQYIYLAMNKAGDKIYPNESGKVPVRCEPGQEYTFTLDMAADSDDFVAIYGIDYLKSIGNFAMIPVTSSVDFSLNGKRLREFKANEKNGSSVRFFPKSFAVGNASNLETLWLHGVNSLSGSVSLASLTRLQDLDMSGTNYGQVSLPQTSSLISVKLPAVAQLSLGEQYNLDTLQLDGYQNLTIVNLDFSSRGNKDTAFLTSLLSDLKEYASRLSQLVVKGWRPSENLPNTQLLNWLASLRDCTIQNSAVNLGSKALTFQEKLSFSKWGNIDSQDNTFYIRYSVQPINNASILGKRINDFRGEITYYLTATGNNFIIPESGSPISWSLASVSCANIVDVGLDYCTVRATDIDSSNSPKILTAIINVKKLNNTLDTIQSQAELYFYPIEPKIGDFAYANGDFSDKAWLGNTLAGIVFKIEDKPEWKDIYVWAVENAEIPISEFGNTSRTASLPWGVYKSGENDPSWSNATLQQMLDTIATNNGGTPVFTTVSQLYDKVTGFYITSSGFGSNNSNNWVNSYTEESDGQLIFKEAAANTACADWDGKTKTQAMVNLANRIGRYLVLPCLQRTGDWREDIPQSGDIFDNVSDLGRAMHLWRNINDPDIWVNATQNIENNRSDQCLYPAAYACYLYTPKTQSWEIKHPQYRAKNWWLPSVAQECRVYWYLYLSQGKSFTLGSYPDFIANYDADTDNAINKQVSEAAIPVFSNIAKRYSDAGTEGMGSVVIPSSFCWCSAEFSSASSWFLYWYNGTLSIGTSNYKSSRHVSRAVVAFRYYKDRQQDELNN